MRSAARRTASGATGARFSAPTQIFKGWTLQGLLIAVISGGMFWLVWMYTSALRDPRYLDGWILAAGMALQLYFHFAIKMAKLSPKSVMRWRKLHIFLGYLLIAVFVSHSDFSLPDTVFEWALWGGFVLVALSGIFGTYLAWALQAKHGINDGVGLDRIPARRAELAREIHSVVTQTNRAPATIALPPPPYDAWIADLYVTHLRDFFDGPRNFTSHLIGSQHSLRRMVDEIDSLSRFVDSQGQEKLTTVKDLVIEKDRLDFARVYLGLTKGWLFVHVPVTYALIVMTVLHVIVVYSFSSGTW